MCPACSAHLVTRSSSEQEQLFCDLNNEGGLQQDLDILPLLTEEVYLKAYPEERKARAFLSFCKEGDVPAIVELLQEDEDEMAGEPHVDVLRYQEPFGERQTGLHAAIEGKSVEVAYLLLLLASDLPLSAFPSIVLQEAERLGLHRGNTSGRVDIRTIQDARHRTAEQLAIEIGEAWRDFIRTGNLTPPGP